MLTSRIKFEILTPDPLGVFPTCSLTLISNPFHLCNTAMPMNMYCGVLTRPLSFLAIAITVPFPPLGVQQGIFEWSCAVSDHIVGLHTYVLARYIASSPLYCETKVHRYHEDVSSYNTTT